MRKNERTKEKIQKARAGQGNKEIKVVLGHQWITAFHFPSDLLTDAGLSALNCEVKHPRSFLLVPGISDHVALSSRWGGNMAATPATHTYTVQVQSNVRGPGQTHKAHIGVCHVCFAWLYILRPKQNL